MNKNSLGFVTILITVFVVLVGIGGFLIYNRIVKPVQEVITGEVIMQIKDGAIPEIDNETEPEEVTEVETEVSIQVFANHNTPEDCWIVYGGKVYDITNSQMHPNMAKTFFSHCGEITGFEEGAKTQHSASSEERLLRFAEYVGVLTD